MGIFWYLPNRRDMHLHMHILSASIRTRSRPIFAGNLMDRILVSGLINVETTLRVDDFALDYEPVRYPFFGIKSSVSGVGDMHENPPNITN